MSTTPRLAKSAARASRGSYCGTSPESFFQTDTEPDWPFGSSYSDGWFRSAAADDLASMDDEDQWMRLWYAPRIPPGRRLWY